MLVALLPRKNSLEILKKGNWYHIPVNSPAEKRIPPRVLAYYQGKSFGKEAGMIRYFEEVEEVEKVKHKEFFPDDENNAYEAEKLYYRLRIKKLIGRHVLIISHRPHRLVFIPTTQGKYDHAEQINDLFDCSPLEDRLWRALKYIDILAERQNPTLPLYREVNFSVRLKRSVALYRSVIGQPRQQELLSFLSSQIAPDAIEDLMDKLLIDLSPPSD